MPRRRLVWLALAGVFLAGMLYTLYVSWRAELLVLDAKANRVLFRVWVRPGDRFTLCYLHSVAKSRVSGTFELTVDYAIAVKETEFGSFGPGLPLLKPGDDYEVKGRVIRQKNLNQVLLGLSFFVHPYTEHELEIRGQKLELSKAVPAGSVIMITVRPPITHWGPKTRVSDFGR